MCIASGWGRELRRQNWVICDCQMGFIHQTTYWCHRQGYYILTTSVFIYKLNTVDTVWESAGVHSLTQMYLWGVQHSVQDLGEVYNPPASTPLVQISSRLVYACTVRKVARGNTGQLFLWQLIQVCHSQRDNKEQYCCIPLEDWKGKYILFLSRDLPQAMTKGLGVEL